MGQTRTKQSALLDRLGGGGVLISDGATGTYLQTHGLEPGGCPEEFNASHPDTVRQMAKSYFDAGSDMVLTNSFGANKFMLKKYGHGDRVIELNRLAAQHARSDTPIRQGDGDSERHPPWTSAEAPGGHLQPLVHLAYGHHRRPGH